MNRHRIASQWSRRVLVLMVVASSIPVIATFGDTPLAQAADPVGLFEPVDSVATGSDLSVLGRVVADGRGTFHHVVRDQQGGGQYIVYRRSTDGGRTFQVANQFAGLDGGATDPDIDVDGDHVAITFRGRRCVTFTSCDVAPFLVDSVDGGRSWRGPTLLYQGSADVVDVDVDGPRTWVAWSAYSGRPVELRGTVDGGVTFFARESYPGLAPRVSAAGGTMVMSWLVDPDSGGSKVVTAANEIVGAPFELGAGFGVVGVAAAEDSAHVLGVTAGFGLAVRTSDVTSPLLGFGPPVTVATSGTFSGDIAAAPGLVAVSWTDRNSRFAFVSSSADRGRTFSVPVPVGVGDNTELGIAVDPDDRLVARFDWTVPDRYVDDDGDGLRDPANPFDDLGLDKILVDRIDLDVTLDACGSKPSPGRSITGYSWTVGGVSLPETSSCTLKRSMRDDVPVEVELEITETGGTTATVTQTVTPQDLVVVSIGDAVASGEGIPHRPALPATLTEEDWQQDACHRSASAGPALAAAELERADPRTSVTFVQLACSGAAIMDVPAAAGTPPGPDDDPATGGLLDAFVGVEPIDATVRPSQLAQLDALRGQRDVDVVFLSAGASDIDLPAVIEDCLLTAPTAVFGCHRSATKDSVDARLADLPRRFAALDAALDARGIDPSRVVISDYPDVTADSRGLANLRCVAEAEQIGEIAGYLANLAEVVENTAPSPVVSRIARGVNRAADLVSKILAGGLVTDDESAWLRTGVIGGLNGAVRSAAAAHGWRTASVESRFARRGYCSTEPLVVTLGESLQTQLDVHGTMHPNRAGQVAYGEVLAAAAARRLLADTAVESAAPLGADAIGDLYVTTQDGDSITVTSLRDTGASPYPLGSRRLDRTTSDTWMTSLGTASSVAADRTSAVTTWTQFWYDAQGFHYRTRAAQVVISENVAVTSVRVVQAPSDGDRLVTGKATTVLARVDARLGGPMTLDVTTELVDEEDLSTILSVTEPVLLRPGINDVLLPSTSFVVPDGATVFARVRVTDPPSSPAGSDADNEFESTRQRLASPVVSTRPYSVVFLPVETDGGPATSCAQAASSAGRYVPFARDAMPVADDGLVAEVACNALTGLQPTDQGVMEALADLDRLARLTNRDVVVGVVPDGWLQSAIPRNRAVGFAADRLRAVLVEASAERMVLVHEIGHVLGVGHTATPVAAPGVRVPRRTVQRGTDWMNPTVSPTTWTGADTWEQLIDALRDPTRIPAYPDPASGYVFVRGSVWFDQSTGKWVASQGEWSPAPTNARDLELDALELDGYIRVLDDNSEPIGDPTDFDVLEVERFPAAPGEDVAGGAYVVAVAIPDGAALVQVFLDGELVEERPVSPTAPTVTVAAPTGGAIAPASEPLNVSWTSTVAPGFTNTATVMLSGDGGATWLPVATVADANSATVTVPGTIRGDQVVARVVVSDGVRSAMDDSEPFTVRDVARGPQRVAYVEMVPDNASVSWIGWDNGIRTMAPDGTDDRLILPKVWDDVFPNRNRFIPVQPDWSPDGRQLVVAATAFFDRPELYSSSLYVVREDLFVTDADGQNRVRITRPVSHPLAGPTTGSMPMEFTCPDWSPDGSRISSLAVIKFVGNTSPQVVTMAADGSDLRFHGVVGRGNRNGCPRWSPDGSMLAMAIRYTFVGGVGEGLPARSEPWVFTGLEADMNNTVITTWSTAVESTTSPGEVLATIVHPGVGNEALPQGASWIPDGSALLVGMEGAGPCGVVRVESDGSGTTRVMNCPNARKPNLAGTSQLLIQDFAPSSPQVAPDGRIAFASGYNRSFNDYTFASTLCTIPGDSNAGTPEVFLPNVTPGLSCVVGPGEFADLPLTGLVNGKVQIDWSAGPVLDGEGGSGGVVIPDEPPPPAAAAGGPYVAVQFEPVMLDAGGSGLLAGPDGNAAVVEWDLDDDGVFDDAAGIRPEVTFPEAGSIAVRVRITPPGGSPLVSAPTTVEVAAAAVPDPEIAPDAEAPDAPALTPVDLEVVVPPDGAATMTLRTSEGVAVPFVVRTIPDPAEATVGAADPAVPAGVTSPPFDVAADGRILVRASAGFLGVTSFTYGLAPDGGPVATVTVRVSAPQSPVAGADTVEVVAGERTVVDPADLLGNDSDAAVDVRAASSLEIVSVFAGENAEAWLGADGSVNVVGGSPGTGSFRYVVADANGATATGDVSVSIRAAGGSSGVPTSTAPVPTATEAPVSTGVETRVDPMPASPSWSDQVDPVPSTTTTWPSNVRLPETGADVMRTSDLAALLVAAGFIVLLTGRVRRRSTPGD
jgi:hypothetical protein